MWDKLHDVVPEEILRIGKEAIEMLPMPMQWKFLVDIYGLMKKKNASKAESRGVGVDVLPYHMLFKKKRERLSNLSRRKYPLYLSDYVRQTSIGDMAVQLQNHYADQ